MDDRGGSGSAWDGGSMSAESAMTAFLDAAYNGDVDGVDAWLASDPCGDVNAARGEGWTALLYAVSRSHLAVAQQLVAHPDIDMNATSAIGTSALVMALKHKSNTMIQLLLTHGASRYTISHALMTEALASKWMWPHVKHMLSPQWSIRWSPALHTRFPADQREKCRLVVFANTLALRKRRQQPHRHLQSQREVQSFLWELLDALGVTERPRARATGELNEERDRLLRRSATLRGAVVTPIQWLYLPQPIVHHIIEFAVFLW